MRPDKLRNLLQEMDTRLARIERAIQKSDPRFEGAGFAGKKLNELRSEVRRQLGKIDTLRTADVERLEGLIGTLQNLAEGRYEQENGSHVSGHVRVLLHDFAGIANLTAGLRIGLNQLGPDEVLDTVPGQKPAAFQFGFEGDRVVVVDQPLRTREREKDIAAAALDTAMEKGAYVNDQLSLSNCSPRLRDAFTTLQEKLETRANIIQIGMYNQTCGRVLGGDAEELSPTLFELLRSHVELVFAAAAQFEDWRVFRENAIDIDRDSVAALSQSLVALSRDLEARTDTALEVTIALGTVTQWANSKDADKRDVLAMTGTLQNFWSAIAKSALGKEVFSEGRKLVAKAIIGLLVASTSAGVLLALGKIPGAEWIETTVSYFKTSGEGPTSEK
jgi:hypothetical protein